MFIGIYLKTKFVLIHIKDTQKTFLKDCFNETVRMQITLHTIFPGDVVKENKIKRYMKKVGIKF